MFNNLHDALEHNRQTQNPVLDLGKLGLKGTEPALQKLQDFVWVETLILSNWWFDEEGNFVESQNTGEGNMLTCLPPCLPAQITYVIASHHQIVDLQPLQHLRNLTNLNLESNQIVDLQPLQHLRNLTDLNLSYHQIADLQPLQHLRNLTNLNLSYHQIADLQPLQHLRNLTDLNLSYNQIADLQPLQHLRNLTNLNLSYNQIADLQPLQHLRNLTDLDLPNNQIADLQPLQHLRNLTYLDLPNNQIADLQPLQHLRNLTYLDLESNQIVDLQPLQHLRNLTDLNLSYNQIADLLPLQHLRNLTNLNLSYNQIADLQPLQHLRNLTYLDLPNNQIADLQPLQHLRNLTNLNLSYNQIADLQPLQHLRNLTYLDLPNNQIADLQPLQHLGNLTNLNLESNQIADLQPLQHLRNLTYLDLPNNQIADLQPLQHLRNLTYLDLESNQIKYFDAALLRDWERLTELCLRNNAIQNIDAYIINQHNCLPLLQKSLLDARKHGTIAQKEIKVLVIGNGRVGKSCWVDSLMGRDFDAQKNSTHAIQLAEFALPHTDYLLRIWDFGGQDLYHATHRLFMQTRALFVLLWDLESENSPEDAEGYENHPLAYWLNYAHTLGKGSPVLLLQTKTDLRAEHERMGFCPPDMNALRKRYPDILACHEFSNRERRNMRMLLGALADTTEAVLAQNTAELPKNWYDLQNAIRACVREEQKTLSLPAYRALAQANAVENAEILLPFFTDKGEFFYREGLFNNEIILDQRWAIEAVYTLLDRQSAFFKELNQRERKGIFKLADLARTWEKYNKEEQKLFLSFMRQCELCFMLKRDYENTEYMCPVLLPTEAGKILAHFEELAEGRTCLHFAFEYDFLHYGIVQSFLVRAGRLAEDERGIWKYGIWLKAGKANALVQARKQENRVHIWLVGEDMGELLARIRNEFKEIHQSDEGITESLSVDGKAFIPLRALQEAQEQKQAQTFYQNQSFTLADFAPIFQHLRDFVHFEGRLQEEGIDVLTCLHKALDFLGTARLADYFLEMGKIRAFMPDGDKPILSQKEEIYLQGKDDENFIPQLTLLTRRTITHWEACAPTHNGKKAYPRP